MARRMERGELETQWFARHRSTPITEIPKEWPEEYRRVVERRIEIIESNSNIGLIERPECKRRWQSEPVGGTGGQAPHHVAPGPVRGAVPVVRRRRARAR